MDILKKITDTTLRLYDKTVPKINISQASKNFNYEIKPE